MLNDNAKAFFWHVSSEHALRNGWDMESDIEDFFGRNNIDLQSVVYSVSNGEEYVNLTELDVLQASLGHITEGFRNFWGTVKLKDEVKPEDTILISMHSGSSFHLRREDIQELLNGV